MGERLVDALLRAVARTTPTGQRAARLVRLLILIAAIPPRSHVSLQRDGRDAVTTELLDVHAEWLNFLAEEHTATPEAYTIGALYRERSGGDLAIDRPVARDVSRR